MELRHILLVVALIAASIFVIPAVYSLFAGQHWFYDTGTSHCLKCHSDVKNDLDSSTHHRFFTCENCHDLNINPDQTHSNAVTTRCLDCHGTPPRFVNDSMGNILSSPVARVFGENIDNKESHNPFVEGANNSPLRKGENEACILCHTKKSLRISLQQADTYRFIAKRLTNSTWQLSDFSKNIEFTGSLLIQANESAGQHSVTLTADLRCEKCHYNIRDELNNSFHHTYFSCDSCHKRYSEFHASSTPPCLDCHGTTPGIVTDQRGDTFIAHTASVYADNQNGADAHKPFVLSSFSSNISTDSDPSCSSCHSSFNNKMSFIRPEFIEWDVVNSGGTWLIQNLTFGAPRETIVTKNYDGKMHNISLINNINCESCHEDIRQAVALGGHSNEQWMQKHNYASYGDMSSYCKSCHRPLTYDSSGKSPFPAYPFNSAIHGAMVLSCLDCHNRSGTIILNINGDLVTPPYESSEMGGIETSIAQQPAFVQSYLCMACKNTRNPTPGNPLHFKMFTEPQVIIYVNDTQQYPR